MIFYDHLTDPFFRHLVIWFQIVMDGCIQSNDTLYGYASKLKTWRTTDLSRFLVLAI